MKKYFLIIFVLFLQYSFARTVYNNTNLDFDLLCYRNANESAQVMECRFNIVNYCTFTVKLSDLRIVLWLKPDLGKTFAYDSWSSQADIRSPTHGWVRTVSSAFTVSFFTGIGDLCEISGGVQHYAQVTVIARYNGNEVIEGNGYYYWLNASGNVSFRIRYTDWSNMTKNDDYYSTVDTNLSTFYNSSGKSGGDYKFAILQFSPDNGVTWISVCESKDSSGTADTNSGVWPCNISFCQITETNTITSTITNTITPTITNTITPTITNTITPSITNTITPIITNTITPSITNTIIPTIINTITPTITPTLTPIISNVNRIKWFFFQ